MDINDLRGLSTVLLMVTFIGLFGLLSIGGWSQPYFHDATEQFTFIVFGLGADERVQRVVIMSPDGSRRIIESPGSILDLMP